MSRRPTKKHQVTIMRDRVRAALARHIRPWRARHLPVELFVDGIDGQRPNFGVAAPDFFAAIEELGMADEPSPKQIVDKLELFNGATYRHAVSLLERAWEQPIQLTPETDQEAALLKISATVERCNATLRPRETPLPVPYPAHQRVRH